MRPGLTGGAGEDGEAEGRDTRSRQRLSLRSSNGQVSHHRDDKGVEREHARGTDRGGDEGGEASRARDTVERGGLVGLRGAAEDHRGP